MHESIVLTRHDIPRTTDWRNIKEKNFFEKSIYLLKTRQLRNEFTNFGIKIRMIF